MAGYTLRMMVARTTIEEIISLMNRTMTIVRWWERISQSEMLDCVNQWGADTEGNSAVQYGHSAAGAKALHHGRADVQTEQVCRRDPGRRQTAIALRGPTAPER